MTTTEYTTVINKLALKIFEAMLEHHSNDMPDVQIAAENAYAELLYMIWPEGVNHLVNLSNAVQQIRNEGRVVKINGSASDKVFTIEDLPVYKYDHYEC